MSDNFLSGRIWRRPTEAFIPGFWKGLPDPPLDDAPPTFGYDGTPLEADRLSRLISGQYSSCIGPSRKLSFNGSPGSFWVTTEVPDGCYTDQELDEIRTTILQLNPFAKVPVTRFEWRPREASGTNSEKNHFETQSDLYDIRRHTITLSHQPVTAPHVRRIEWTRTVLAHEIGHAIYHQKKFFKDGTWQRLYYYGLLSQKDRKIYEIIDDSNYLRDSEDSVGHPSDSASEAFASSVHAYFLYADQFAAYIRNERTPESMRIFGKLAWVYMRERVFGGSVFTSDKIDPFAGEQLESLLAQIPSKKDSLIALFRDPDVEVRRKMALDFGFAAMDHDLHLESYWTGDSENEVPALVIAVQDTDDTVRHYGLRTLQTFGPAAKDAIPTLVDCLQHKDPKTRKAAAITLHDISPKAASLVPELWKAGQNGDLEASEAAHLAIKKLFKL